MVEVITFLHVLGAIAAGYYILFPFLMLRIGKLSTAAQEGYVNALWVANRIGQYIFIAQFITGGYLISKAKYEVIWIVLVIVIFIVLAALAGMMGKPMKRMIANIKTGKEISALVQRATLFSFIISIGFLILVIMMSFPAYR